jgi:general secretion pathway protein A
LQIVLVGQPELDEKLDSIDLRQLKQRIALRASLGPLDAEETSEYIERRLQIAGADPQRGPIFPAETVAAIFRHSRGLPRLINSISENALVAAYARQVPTVSPEIVENVAREFRLHVVGTTAGSETSDGEKSAQRTAKLLLDLAATLRKPANGSNSGAPIGIEAIKHEPYI